MHLTMYGIETTSRKKKSVSLTIQQGHDLIMVSIRKAAKHAHENYDKPVAALVKAREERKPKPAYTTELLSPLNLGRTLRFLSHSDLKDLTQVLQINSRFLVFLQNLSDNLPLNGSHLICLWHEECNGWRVYELA